MIRSAVTISLVPEAKGGPFVFWEGLADGCRRAAELGFDAVEVFPPSIEAVREAGLGTLLKDHGLSLAAIGTGAGWVKHKLTLTNPDADHRKRAREFIRDIIELAAEFNASAILGSMQGRWGDGTTKEQAMTMLTESLNELGNVAGALGTTLFYEFLNRYETNLVTNVEDAVKLVHATGDGNIKVLADLFHMNIEEANLADALRRGGAAIGHVHFADSNRRAAGMGHTDFDAVAAALRDIGYDGYASAEIIPLPDSEAAAKQTIETFRRLFR